eukprot:symbB.v1.2.029529.t3/scaffold3233.1/size60571/5
MRRIGAQVLVLWLVFEPLLCFEADSCVADGTCDETGSDGAPQSEKWKVLRDEVLPPHTSRGKSARSLIEQEVFELEALSELYHQQLALLEDLQRGLHAGLGRHLPKSNVCALGFRSASAGACLELVALPTKGDGVRTNAFIDAECCLLAEPPLVMIQLASSKRETSACEHCLNPLFPSDAMVTCGCATFCSTECLASSMASGHSFLCTGIESTSDLGIVRQLDELLQELGNIGEAIRLCVRLLARGAVEGSYLACGLWGVPWWHTVAGFEGPLSAEALETTDRVLELIGQLMPLPEGFDVKDLATLVGRVRMNAVEVVVQADAEAEAFSAARGLALYLVASAVNHDCKPNCALQSCLPMPELRGWAVLQALRDLEEGEEVTIEYVEDSPDRHEQLLEQWRFQCNCEEQKGAKIRLSFATSKFHSRKPT